MVYNDINQYQLWLRLKKEGKRNEKNLTLLLALVMCLSLVACGSDRNQTQAITDSPTVAPAAPETEAMEPAPVVEELALGDSIQIGNATIRFDSMSIVPELKFSTSEYSSTSLYVEDGCQLLLVTGYFANNSGSSIDTFAFQTEATANGEFSYDRVDISFKKSNTFSIEPLEECEFYMYVSIPQKLVDMFETATFDIAVNDDFSPITTVWNMDGTSTVEADHFYRLTASPGAAAAEETTSVMNNTSTVSNPAIQIGDTIVTDDYEFTLNNVELIYELEPQNTTSVYTSYVAPAGKVYIHIDATYYNTSKRDVCIRDLPTPTADYDNGFIYEGFAVVDKDDNSFTWASSYVVCTPLSKCHYHGLIECPEVVDEGDGTLFILLPLADGNTYRFDIR